MNENTSAKVPKPEWCGEPDGIDLVCKKFAIDYPFYKNTTCQSCHYYLEEPTEDAAIEKEISDAKTLKAIDSALTVLRKTLITSMQILICSAILLVLIIIYALFMV